MEEATLTRSRPGPDVARARAAVSRLPLPKLALGGLSLATLIGFFAYPTYPNYDSYYSLLWGREVLHGITPSFKAFNSPTGETVTLSMFRALR